MRFLRSQKPKPHLLQLMNVEINDKDESHLVRNHLPKYLSLLLPKLKVIPILYLRMLSSFFYY